MSTFNVYTAEELDDIAAEYAKLADMHRNPVEPIKYFNGWSRASAIRYAQETAIGFQAKADKVRRVGYC